MRDEGRLIRVDAARWAAASETRAPLAAERERPATGQAPRSQRELVRLSLLLRPEPEGDAAA